LPNLTIVSATKRAFGRPRGDVDADDRFGLPDCAAADNHVGDERFVESGLLGDAF
jgi:hypothetical protein